MLFLSEKLHLSVAHPCYDYDYDYNCVVNTPRIVIITTMVTTPCEPPQAVFYIDVRFG